MDGAILDGASLQIAVLDRASLIGASLVGVDLTGADLEEADLWQADLSFSTMFRARRWREFLRGPVIWLCREPISLAWNLGLPKWLPRISLMPIFNLPLLTMPIFNTPINRQNLEYILVLPDQETCFETFMDHVNETICRLTLSSEGNPAATGTLSWKKIDEQIEVSAGSVVAGARVNKRSADERLSRISGSLEISIDESLRVPTV